MHITHLPGVTTWCTFLHSLISSFSKIEWLKLCKIMSVNGKKWMQKIMHENILSELYNTANYASASPKNEIFVANETFLMHSYLYVKAFVMRRYLMKFKMIALFDIYLMMKNYFIPHFMQKSYCRNNHIYLDDIIYRFYATLHVYIVLLNILLIW